MFRTQKYISAAVHLGKAEKAMEQKRFETAQKELEQVLEKFPDDVTTNADMIIASSFNMDIESVKTAYYKIADKKIEDADFFKRIESSITYATSYAPSDTVMVKKIDEVKNDREKLLALYKTSDTAQAIIKLYIANQLFELKDYASVEMISKDVLSINPEFHTALSLMSAAKRNTGKYDEALEYCDRMLDVNKEDIYAISQKARIELKRKHDKQAATYAREAMYINPDSDSALEAMIMVDHFTGRKKESRANFATLKTHAYSSGDSTILNRVSAIISGSEVYR
ncbi:MAG: hypothetical protein EOP47_21950 [Sphingobacteriaceae bacterium]|nr:MAG: hypothetical protein EOP47_21950 [Sphingobacteriaceae bacterium]